MVKKRRRLTAACKFRIMQESVEGSKTVGRSLSEYVSQVQKNRVIPPTLIGASSIRLNVPYFSHFVV